MKAKAQKPKEKLPVNTGFLENLQQYANL